MNRKWWALGSLSLAVLALGLDATVLGIALPTLAKDLHASTSDLQWFVSAYTLALTAAILPGGLLGDRFGRKRVLLGALTVFGLGSVACALSTTPGAFVAARVVLGLGAAAVVPLSLSVLTVLFSDEERPKAVGVWAAANFVALPAGPIFGGWLIAHAWWGWVFLVNVPVVLVGILAVALLLPESRSSTPPRIDLAGILLSSGGLAVLTYGFIQAGQQGWGDGGALAAIAGGLVVLAAFALWELRLSRIPAGQPLIDLDLFRAPSFTWGTILAAMGVFGMFGILFIMPMFFQAVEGTDAQGSGVRLLPLIAGIVVGAGGGGRLATRLGAKLTVACGLAILAGGLAAGATTSVESGAAFIALWTGAVGVGMGVALTTAASGALAELSEERAGVGSAVMQAVQKAGAPLAAAILGSVLNATYRGRLALDGLPPAAAGAARGSVFGGLAVAERLHAPGLATAVRAAFAGGVDSMLWVSFAIAAVGVLGALAFLPGRALAARLSKARGGAFA